MATAPKGTTAERDSWAHLTDAHLVSRLATALREMRSARTAAGYIAARCEFDRLNMELGWRAIDHALACIAEREAEEEEQ